jgi:hypothetical protein
MDGAQSKGVGFKPSFFQVFEQGKWIFLFLLVLLELTKGDGFLILIFFQEWGACYSSHTGQVKKTSSSIDKIHAKLIFFQK